MSKIDMNQRLSEHFTLRELTQSGTAIKHNINNTPEAVHVERLRTLCQRVLEPLRRRFGVIRITSGYRCAALNAKVGGKPNSQHLQGEAADIHVSCRQQGEKMFAYVRDNLSYDQLLLERRARTGTVWLHVSCKQQPAANRHEALHIDC